MLPEIRFSPKRYDGDEIFFDVDQELTRVLMQDNPVYLVLGLPGLDTNVIVCFPAPTITRVYGSDGDQSYFIGESEDQHDRPIWTAPAEVSYRYGMRLLPWMFIGHLGHGIPVEQDHVVNYIVLNCDSGRRGINIRLFRTCGGREKKREWLEIHQFDAGNEHHFAEEWRKQSRMIARFVPNSFLRPAMTWQPEGGWAKYLLTRTPCSPLL